MAKKKVVCFTSLLSTLKCMLSTKQTPHAQQGVTSQKLQSTQIAVAEEEYLSRYESAGHGFKSNAMGTGHSAADSVKAVMPKMHCNETRPKMERARV